jgi:TolA-binding protein
MSLKNLSGTYKSKNSLFILFILFSFLLAGCGEVEEVTGEEKSPQVAAAVPAPPSEQPKAELSPMDEVLYNFVGEVEQLPEASPKQASSLSPTQLAEYEKQINELRTENTDLKQKVVKFEQENRGINARIAEIEAKYATEKMRADKADELTKLGPQLPKVVEEQPDEPVVSSYDEALKAYRAKNFAEAAKRFKAVAASTSNSKERIRARYWLGESYYAQRKYKSALPLFQEVLKAKGSEKKADAQYMLAQTYDRLGNKARAKSEYEKVVKKYPMSRNVKKAKKRWAQLK